MTSFLFKNDTHVFSNILQRGKSLDHVLDMIITEALTVGQPRPARFASASRHAMSDWEAHGLGSISTRVLMGRMDMSLACREASFGDD